MSLLLCHVLKVLGNSHKVYERLFIDSDCMAEYSSHVLCKPELYTLKVSCSIQRLTELHFKII